MDYARMAGIADKLLSTVGMRVSVSRAGASVGSGSGVFVNKTKQDQTTPASSVLAQTAMTERVLLLSGLVREVEVGDTVVAERITYKVTGVEIVRPTTTTLLYKLTVV
jgi:hypothetical protein